MNGFFSAVSFAMILLAGTPNSPEWTADYGQALKDAKAEGKPLIVVLEEPTQPDRRVKQIRDSISPAEQELLQPYKLCRVDVSTKYGKKVASAFRTDQFPMTVIINDQCTRILYKKTGQFSTKDWVLTLVQYRDGKGPVKKITQAVLCKT